MLYPDRKVPDLTLMVKRGKIMASDATDHEIAVDIETYCILKYSFVWKEEWI